MTTEIPPPPAHEGPLSPPYVRLLKIAVVTMGIMIVVGLAAVAWRIVYLASGGTRQAQSVVAVSGAIRSGTTRSGTTRSGTTPGELNGGPLAPSMRLAIPAGASIRHLALSGNHLAIHYDSPHGPAIAILDTATGNVVSRIDIVPQVPR